MGNTSHISVLITNRRVVIDFLVIFHNLIFSNYVNADYKMNAGSKTEKVKAKQCAIIIYTLQKIHKSLQLKTINNENDHHHHPNQSNPAALNKDHHIW